MKHTFLIFLGAGLGGVARYWMSNGVHVLLGREFPYGTLIVNVSGSFLMGLLYVLFAERFYSMAPALRSLCLIGFLGGYTTFSSFSIETFNLIESGAWMSAMFNVMLNMSLCLIFVWLGVLGGRQ
jgi:CrcB protein